MHLGGGKKTPTQKGQYKNTSHKVIAAVALLLWYAATHSNYRQRKTSNQHVNLAEGEKKQKNKSFLRCGSKMQLRRSGVSS